jgi:hypothetical protein
MGIRRVAGHVVPYDRIHYQAEYARVKGKIRCILLLDYNITCSSLAYWVSRKFAGQDRGIDMARESNNA